MRFYRGSNLSDGSLMLHKVNEPSCDTITKDKKKKTDHNSIAPFTLMKKIFYLL